MKKYLNAVIEWIVHCSLIYAISILIFVLIKMILGETSVTIKELLSLFCASTIGSILQYLFFSETRTHKMTYTKRLILFSLFFLPILAFVAYQFQWLPTTKVSAWFLFVMIYITILIVMTLGFEIYFKITKKRYEGIIGQYKKEKDAL